ncbi:MAG: hypothetical protein FWF31_05550 [Desulfobulbus sp.]|nr:hypothetical protein [Desulfobulbus sp.]
MLIRPLRAIFKSDLPGSAMRHLGGTESMRGEQLVAEGGLEDFIWSAVSGLFDLLKKMTKGFFQADACRGNCRGNRAGC